MRFDEMGKKDGKILMLLPGTCMNYETNFSKVLDALKEKYHLICVNYDGFDGTDTEFKDMIDVTEKIEKYIKDNEEISDNNINRFIDFLKLYPVDLMVGIMKDIKSNYINVYDKAIENEEFVGLYFESYSMIRG